MHLTQQALVLAALGLSCAIAQPAGSLHRHLHKHKKDLANVNWSDESNYKNVDWATVNYGDSSTAAAPAVAATSASAIVVASSQAPQASAPYTTSAAAAAATTTSASASATPSTTSSAAAATSSASSSSSSSGTDYNSPSINHHPSGCPAGTGFGAGTDAIAGSNVDTYVGNVGSPYGCNMKLVDAPDGYDYTNTFTNSGAASINVIIWNKAGDQSKGQGPNGGQSATPNLGFTLAAGASRTVAFDANSQVAWSRDCARRSDNNSPDCTWGEGDFGNVSNGGWSGYDVSSIQNSRGNDEAMCITSSKQNAGKESSNRVNNWVAADQANQGAGGNIPPGAGPVRLVTTFG